MAAPLLGVNFSHRQAAWLGLDPDETYNALLNDLRVRYFRLSLFWDEIQPEPTRYDFSTIQRQLDLAESRAARVLLTVGLKGQRHPEYYPPAWLVSENAPPHGAAIAAQPRIVAHLMLMLERAVAILADYGCIDAWQVENEPFLPAAGRTVGWRFDEATLRKEISAVEGSDSRHRPIVINHSSTSIVELDWARALRLGDVLAQDVYTRKPVDWGPIRYFNPFILGPVGPNLFVQSTLAHRFGRRFWINELQAEPWERKSLLDLHGSDIGSISPDRIVTNLKLVRRAKPERICFWGAEWWRYQQQQGDSRYWELARRLFEPAFD